MNRAIPEVESIVRYRARRGVGALRVGFLPGNHMIRLAYAGFATSVLASAAASFAATKTYVATGSSNFSTELAWSPSGAPTSTDSIVLGNAITADSTITIDSGGVVAATTVDTTRTYTIALTSGGPTVFNAGALNLAAGTLAMAPRGGSNTLRASSLTIAGSGATLNLHDNSAIFEVSATTNSPQEVIRAAILAGKITGDTTSFNRIGYSDAGFVFHGASSGTFAGQAVTVEFSTVLLRHTLAGDTDLDGKVIFDDLIPLAMTYNRTDTIWRQGDFNYDGITNFDDLVLLAQNYNKSYAPSLSELTSLGGAGFAADWQLALSLVPEPTALAALVSAVPCAIRRRSR